MISSVTMFLTKLWKNVSLHTCCLDDIWCQLSKGRLTPQWAWGVCPEIEAKKVAACFQLLQTEWKMVLFAQEIFRPDHHWWFLLWKRPYLKCVEVLSTSFKEIFHPKNENYVERDQGKLCSPLLISLWQILYVLTSLKWPCNVVRSRKRKK